MLQIIKRMPTRKVTIAVFFLLVQVGANLSLPYLTAHIVSNGIIHGDIPYILKQGGIMLLMTIVSLIGALFNIVISAQIAYQLGMELRQDVFQKALRFSKKEFDEFGSSALITRCTNDVMQVQTLIEMGLKFLILSPVYLLGGIFLTYLLSPALSMVFVAIIPLMAISAFVIYRFASPLYQKMQKLIDELNLFFRENLTGIKIIRAFNKEEFEYEKYRSTNRDYTRTSITAATIMSVFIPFITLCMSLTTLAITWIGGKAIVAGTIEIGAIIGAISYSAQILVGFKLLTNVILAIPRGQVSANRIQEVLDMPLSIIDGDDCSKAITEKRLIFENVSFSYREADRKTLSDISFSADKGETIAIIGSTGDGKTTLMNLITRLYDVDEGAIRLGNTDICDFSQQSLRDFISYVPQSSVLFFGTIRSNMLLGKPDATDDEIWNALRIACADDFVKALKAELDSPVDKNGSNFSGGQRQRLCIARALLKESIVYLFDDSFSALDFKTDSMIRKEMKPALAEAITIIVAQRISTVMNADKIIVLDKGMIASIGKHEQLKKTCPIYQEIIYSQFYKEEQAG